MRPPLLVAVAFALLGACSSGDDHNPTGGDGTLPPTGLPTCSNQDTGCPCATPGQTIDCKVFRRSGDYVSCSTGQRVCGADGKWGECSGGDQVAQ